MTFVACVPASAVGSSAPNVPVVACQITDNQLSFSASPGGYLVASISDETGKHSFIMLIPTSKGGAKLIPAGNLFGKKPKGVSCRRARAGDVSDSASEDHSCTEVPDIHADSGFTPSLASASFVDSKLFIQVSAEAIEMYHRQSHPIATAIQLILDKAPRGIVLTNSDGTPTTLVILDVRPGRHTLVLQTMNFVVGTMVENQRAYCFSL